MWDKKAFPRPWPSAAPFTSPAISTMFKKAGTLLKTEIHVHFINIGYYIRVYIYIDNNLIDPKY